MNLLGCVACGAHNRVVKYSIGHRPVCGRCQKALPEPTIYPLLRVLNQWKFWLLLAAIFGGAYFSQNQPTVPLTKQAKLEAAFNQPVVPISQGIYRSYTSRKAIAPFRIVTSPGEEDYFVKLVDASSGSEVISMFIRGGETFETQVPLGNFRVKYATGQYWYGDQHLFGPTTQYSEADKTFEFSRSGNQINGYTVELIKQQSGNLHTKNIGAAQF